MKIAIPIADGKLCMHFGHCEQFALIEVDKNTREIKTTDYLTPPPHEPGLYPKWLSSQGAEFIIAGGMGGRAKDLFSQQNITVITGASPDKPEKIAEDFLNNTLVTGPNTCDTGHDSCGH